MPAIKKEAAKLKARPGPGEKRQKNKDVTLEVSYTGDKHERSAEAVARNLSYPERTQVEREAATQAEESVLSSPKA